MGVQVNVFAAKSENLSLTLATHKVEIKQTLTKLSSDLHSHVVVHTSAHTPQCINSLFTYLIKIILFIVEIMVLFRKKGNVLSQEQVSLKPSSAAVLTPEHTAPRDLVFHDFNPHSKHRFRLKVTDFYLTEDILTSLALRYPSLHLTGSFSVPLQSFEAGTWSHSTFCGLSVLFL